MARTRSIFYDEDEERYEPDVDDIGLLKETTLPAALPGKR
jgi:hypothetical protein